MEALAGDFGRHLRVEELQAFTDVPVGFRLKIKRGAHPAALFHVFGIVLAHRHAGMGDVGDGQQDVRCSVSKSAARADSLLALLGQAFHLVHDGGGVAAFFFRRAMSLLAAFCRALTPSAKRTVPAARRRWR